MKIQIALACLLICVTPVLAGEAPPAAADPQLEKRVMAVAEELRCLVCQNQTIADSSAPLAIDLREQVREKMKQGMSNGEIVDYMVARYGDFVRYRPPLKATTVLLWFGPLLLMAAGIFALVRLLKARRFQPAAPLSEAERARASALLTGGDERR